MRTALSPRTRAPEAAKRPLRPQCAGSLPAALTLNHRALQLAAQGTGPGPECTVVHRRPARPFLRTEQASGRSHRLAMLPPYCVLLHERHMGYLPRTLGLVLSHNTQAVSGGIGWRQQNGLVRFPCSP